MDEEYYCRQCQYTANQPGVCPQHKEELVDFATYAAWAGAKKEARINRIVYFILFLVIAFALIAVLSRYF